MLQQKFQINSDRVTQGYEAVDKFIENRRKLCCDAKYKLVIMDLNLPEMQGFDAIE